MRAQTIQQRHDHQPTKLNHIMIIAEHPELAESLQIDFNAEGYQVSVINDGLRGLLAVQRVETDLLLIGWQPPNLSGIDICTRLRTGSWNGPIILLTQGDSAEDRIAGLEAGANDCISLPFVKRELVARVEASLRRRDPSAIQPKILRCADLQLNPKTREVCRDDQFIRLTAKEFDLLECLMDHYFQVLTRSQILENVWGYDYIGSSNIIEVYIRYLRRKLEAKNNKRLIHTVRSVGYILRDDL